MVEGQDFEYSKARTRLSGRLSKIQRLVSFVRLFPPGKFVANSCGGAKRTFPGGSSLLGGLAVRNHDPFETPRRRHARAQLRRTRCPQRHSQAAHFPLRQSFPDFIPILHGIPPASNGWAQSFRMAFSRTLFPAATSLRNDSQIHGWF